MHISHKCKCPAVNYCPKLLLDSLDITADCQTLQQGWLRWLGRLQGFGLWAFVTVKKNKTVSSSSQTAINSLSWLPYFTAYKTHTHIYNTIIFQQRILREKGFWVYLSIQYLLLLMGEHGTVSLHQRNKFSIIILVACDKSSTVLYIILIYFYIYNLLYN